MSGNDRGFMGWRYSSLLIWMKIISWLERSESLWSWLGSWQRSRGTLEIVAVVARLEERDAGSIPTRLLSDCRRVKVPLSNKLNPRLLVRSSRRIARQLRPSLCKHEWVNEKWCTALSGGVTLVKYCIITVFLTLNINSSTWLRVEGK